MVTKADRDLIERLHSQTLAGKLTWEQATDWKVVAVLPNKQSFRLTRAPGFTGVWRKPEPPTPEELAEDTVLLEMLDSDGARVVLMNTTDLARDDPLRALLFELHSAATRSDAHVQQQLGEAIRVLDRL